MVMQRGGDCPLLAARITGKGNGGPAEVDRMAVGVADDLDAVRVVEVRCRLEGRRQRRNVG